MYSHLNKKKSNKSTKNKQKNDKDSIMNKLLFNNPDFLKNFRKSNSKTPNKTRVKKPYLWANSNSNINTKKNSSNEMANLLIKMNNNNENKKQNHKNNNIKNNFKELYTSPLIKYINIQEELLMQNKNNNDYINKTLQKQIHSNNRLTRSESFSILENHNNKKNTNNINENNNSNSSNNKSNGINSLLDNKENNINQNNNNNNNISNNINKSIEEINKLLNDKIIKKSNKITKKIYKIESLCQVGYSGPGMVKYNQDNFFIYKNLNDESNVLFIGVCDGHGMFGHDVSKYLITHLPKNLNKALKKTNKYIHHKETLYKTMKEVFINTNKDLCKNPLIDTQFSGSTCVTIILTKNKIISGNAGDSRAVMGRCVNGEWISIDLSHDQKPNDPGERERILSHGGRIEAYKDENGNDFGPKRVWIKNEDIPGLAMSRSFGDEVAASVGTISEPEIQTFDITSDDKFIIIASDGIWEFISSNECVNIIKDYYLKKDLKGCLKYLLNESSKRWIKEEEVIDDITAVLIFFED